MDKLSTCTVHLLLAIIRLSNKGKKLWLLKNTLWFADWFYQVFKILPIHVAA